MPKNAYPAPVFPREDEVEKCLSSGGKECWFLRLFANSPLGIELYNSNGELIHVNQRCLDIFGIQKMSDVAGFKLFDDPNLAEDKKKEIRRGIPVRYEMDFDFDKIKNLKLYKTTKSGRALLDVLVTPLGQKAGKNADGYLAQVEDITEKNRPLKKFMDIFNGINDSVCIYDLTGKFLEINDLGCRRLKYTREEMLKLRQQDINYAEYSKMVLERIKIVQKNGPAVFESIHIAKDGEKIPVEMSAKTINFDGIPAILSVARDITDRKKAEAERAEHQAKLEKMNALMVGRELRMAELKVLGMLAKHWH